MKCWHVCIDVVHIITGVQDQDAVASQGKTGSERSTTSSRSHDNVVILGSRVGLSSHGSRLVLSTVEFLVRVLVASCMSVGRLGCSLLGGTHLTAATPATETAKRLKTFFSSILAWSNSHNAIREWIGSKRAKATTEKQQAIAVQLNGGTKGVTISWIYGLAVYNKRSASTGI